MGLAKRQSETQEYAAYCEFCGRLKDMTEQGPACESHDCIQKAKKQAKAYAARQRAQAQARRNQLYGPGLFH